MSVQCRVRPITHRALKPVLKRGVLTTSSSRLLRGLGRLELRWKAKAYRPPGFLCKLLPRAPGVFGAKHQWTAAWKGAKVTSFAAGKSLMSALRVTFCPINALSSSRPVVIMNLQSWVFIIQV